MRKPRLISHCYSRLLAALVAILSVATSHAWPGDRIETLPFFVNSDFRTADQHPSIAIGANGDFIVVWDGIWGRRFSSDGSPHGDQFRVSPAAQNVRDERPVIAIDSDGDFVVAWFQQVLWPNPGANAIVGQRFNDAGEPVGGAFIVTSSSDPPDHDGPAIGMDADGDFVIIWTAEDPAGGPKRALGQRYDAAGVPQESNFRVNVSTESGASNSAVAMNAAGDFVVAWHDIQNGDVCLEGALCSVQGRSFTADGSALSDGFTVSGTGPGAAVGKVAIAMNTVAGNFVIAFNRIAHSKEFGSESIGIYARRFDDRAVPMGEEFRVSRFGRVQFRGEISSSMNTRGDFVIAWIANDADLYNSYLHTRLFRASGASVTGDDQRFAEQRLYMPAGAFAPRDSAAAIDEQGSFIVAWQSQSDDPLGGTGPNIFGQRFAGPDDIRLSCEDIIATIVGTDRADVITGTPDRDVIIGAGGNDVIRGGAGDDMICGRWGDDRLYGDEGMDILRGATGDDVLDGGADEDYCNGGKHITADKAVNCESSGDVP